MASDIFSDLVLNRYQLRRVEMDSNPEFYGQRVGGGQLGLDFSILHDDEHKNRYQLELNLNINPTDALSEESGLQVSATIVGLFTWRPQDPSADPTQQDTEAVLMNGLSVLYGTLRPIVTGLVQQAGRHRFSLPTIDMRKFLLDYARANVNLDSMTVSQLRELARAERLDLAGAHKKAEIVTAIAEQLGRAND